MQKKFFIIILAVIFLLSACSKKDAVVDITPDDSGAQFLFSSENVQAGGEGATSISAESHGDNVTVSRALAAKMLTMALYDLQIIDSTDREIAFIDTDKSKWYDKYINSAYVNGLMTGFGDKFMPDSPVTLSQTQVLIDKLDPKNKMKLEITAENKDKPVSYALFADLYKKALANMSNDSTIVEEYGVLERAFIVLATQGNSPQLKEWNIVTDKGPITSYGTNLNGYIDKEIRVLEKNGDVLAVLGIESETPTMRNAFVVKVAEGEIAVFSGGCERTYSINRSAAKEKDICDIKISDGKALELTAHTEKARDVINQISDEAVEFKDIGVYPLDANFKVYSATGDAVKWRQLSNLLVGTDIADFYVENGTVRAAVITKTMYPNNLRVLIGTTGFTGFIHNTVTISGTRAFTVSNGSKSETYEAWQPVTVSDEMFGGKSRLYVSTSSDGKIVITSIKRSYSNNESPKYRGALEISKQAGGYVLVNEVNLEEYLYAVVPSEMPSGYGIPASKVQAITARSYAYNQFYANKFHNYGANIDDSVTSQVYNNIPENETSVAAVNETKGQFLAHKGNVISANFFSTSCGTTANSGEVWASASTKQFPASSHEYLISRSQLVDQNAALGDLTKEDAAASFFKNTDIKSFDSSFPWFRWNTVMTSEEISTSINYSIKTRYNANPSLIKTLQNDNVFRSKPIEDIGTVKDITVKARGEGGNILSLIIKGTKATISVDTEYNIRLLIAPAQRLESGKPIALNFADGSKRDDYSIMPSAFYTMDKSYDANGNLTAVKFYGGGNGHGVGMSQNGVKGMIDSGYTAEQILKHYYAGTDIIRMP